MGLAVVAGAPACRAAGATPRAADASAAARPLTCRLHHDRFRTLPRLRPVGWCTAVRPGARLAAGLLAVTPRPHPVHNPHEQFGLMLIDRAGRLRWYRSAPDRAHDLKAVELGGRRLLAYYLRRPGFRGVYHLLDDAYRPAGLIAARRGLRINAHELQVTPQGTAWVSAYPRVRLPGVGLVADYAVQEIDLATGAVLFEWRALAAGIRPRDSFEPRPADGSAWDFFHGNAIEPPTADDPTVIVSSRNESALYGIDRATGALRWTLGGRRDDFGLRRADRFCAQHDVRRLPGGDLTVFDNGGTHLPAGRACPVHAARVQRWRLDVAARRARRVWSRSSRLVTPSGRGFWPGWVGSARLLGNGNLLTAWGSDKAVTEQRRDGRVDLLLRLQRWSYRAVRVRWTGRPAGRPRVAAQRRPGGRVTVWTSWNGSTLVQRWRVLAGASPGALRAAGPPARFAGLETAVTVATRRGWVATEALAADGTVLARSRAVRVRD